MMAILTNMRDNKDKSALPGKSEKITLNLELHPLLDSVYVILHKLLNLSEPEFPCSENGANKPFLREALD